MLIRPLEDNQWGRCRLDPRKSRRELFQRIFALGIFWGGVSPYAATPLIVALSPDHSDITMFRPRSPIGTGNHKDLVFPQSPDTNSTPTVIWGWCPWHFLRLKKKVATFDIPTNREKTVWLGSLLLPLSCYYAELCRPSQALYCVKWVGPLLCLVERGSPSIIWCVLCFQNVFIFFYK